MWPSRIPCQSYLKNRTPYVSIKNNTLKKHTVLSVIPQGPVLSPLLFLINIDNLPNSVNSDIYIFTDDTKLFKLITSHTDK